MELVAFFVLLSVITCLALILTDPSLDISFGYSFKSELDVDSVKYGVTRHILTGHPGHRVEVQLGQHSYFLYDSNEKIYDVFTRGDGGYSRNDVATKIFLKKYRWQVRRIISRECEAHSTKTAQAKLKEAEIALDEIDVKRNLS